MLSNICKKQHESMPAPQAAKMPYHYEMHGHRLVDEYAWLRDGKWPQVKEQKILAHLQEENNYFDNFFAPLAKQKEELFEELKGRVQLTDQSTYTKKDDYFYYSRTESDKDYPIYCRKYGATDATEEIILDVNALAAGKKFTVLGALAISPDHKLLAYSVDFTGAEKFTISVLDLQTKQLLTDSIAGTIGDIVWHENNEGFFYALLNDNWRHDKIMYHAVGQNTNADKLIMHEPDPLYTLIVSKTANKKHIIINSNGHDCNENFVINMNDAAFTPKLVRAKQSAIFYNLAARGDYFFIHTNANAKNFRIARVPVNNFQNAIWEDYIAESEEYLADFDVSADYLVLNYRDYGLPVIKVRHFDNGLEKQINFPDQSFSAVGGVDNFAENDLRINYSSLARPATTFSYNFINEKLAVLKAQEIPSGFNSDEYMVERVLAVSKDGTKVPISLLYKKSLFKKDGLNPLYLYGYGSYGIAMSPAFRNTAISLADRGFVFAIAHIRGGDDLGYAWYEAAKFLTKKRTFEDFIASAEWLIAQRYTSMGNIAICGGSAGGLLIGAVLNERPELFKAAIAHVPFVDMLNTMLDESLPLTPGEFKEWGNPKDKEYFRYMLSYSPYENIEPQKYPAVMVTAGLSDPRVGYWEAAKWVARLRARKTDANKIIFKTNMEAGHRGASGRFGYLKEVAEELVFLLAVFK